VYSEAGQLLGYTDTEGFLEYDTEGKVLQPAEPVEVLDVDEHAWG
jgi:hypothetical protein